MIIFVNGKYIDKIKKKFYYFLYNFYNTDVYISIFCLNFFRKININILLYILYEKQIQLHLKL